MKIDGLILMHLTLKKYNIGAAIIIGKMVKISQLSSNILFPINDGK